MNRSLVISKNVWFAAYFARMRSASRMVSEGINVLKMVLAGRHAHSSSN